MSLYPSLEDMEADKMIKVLLILTIFEFRVPFELINLSILLC